MKVSLVSAYPDAEPLITLRNLAGSGGVGGHSIARDPHEADIILFVENSRLEEDRFYSRIFAHPLTKKYPEKCFMYNEQDSPWCILPGLYVSMPAPAFHSRWMRACGYIHEVNPFIHHDADMGKKCDFLFSFIGRNSHRCRSKIFKLSHSRAMLYDTKFAAFFKEAGGDAVDAGRRRFAHILTKSKFVICPRGCGTASIRLFETMKAGRVPVIIADEWVAPIGPKWNEFSLRVKESEVAKIPHLLEARERDAPLMGSLARRAWEEWFSARVLFERMLSACAELMDGRDRTWPRKGPRYARLRLDEATQPIRHIVHETKCFVRKKIVRHDCRQRSDPLI